MFLGGTAVEELVKYLKALVFIQVHTLAASEGGPKPEILLNKAVFTAREIAEILGKSQAAVAKAIERARKTAKAAAVAENASIAEPATVADAVV
jgi:hypothetical protein